MRVLVEPENVWSKLQELRQYKDSAIIAENEEFDVLIELSDLGKSGLIEVTLEGEVIDEAVIHDKEEAIASATDFYDSYIYDGLAISSIVEDEKPENLIDDREEELKCAVEDMLDVFDDDSKSPISRNITAVEFFKDFVAEVLYKKFNISIYRPMYLEDEHGKDVFEKYPYPEIDF